MTAQEDINLTATNINSTITGELNLIQDNITMSTNKNVNLNSTENVDLLSYNSLIYSLNGITIKNNNNCIDLNYDTTLIKSNNFLELISGENGIYSYSEGQIITTSNNGIYTISGIDGYTNNTQGKYTVISDGISMKSNETGYHNYSHGNMNMESDKGIILNSGIEGYSNVSLGQIEYASFDNVSIYSEKSTKISSKQSIELNSNAWTNISNNNINTKIYNLKRNKLLSPVPNFENLYFDGITTENQIIIENLNLYSIKGSLSGYDNITNATCYFEIKANVLFNTSLLITTYPSSLVNIDISGNIFNVNITSANIDANSKYLNIQVKNDNNLNATDWVANISVTNIKI
jgi:hypothetical protein